MSTSAFLFWVRIKVYEGEYPLSPIKDYYYWEGPFAIRTKWSWYFKYRAALYQVANPKSLVEFEWGTKEPDTKTLKEHMRVKMASKKRMISKISNDLEQYKAWLIETNIFGLDGDDGRIMKAERKLEKYRVDLQLMEQEYDNLNN